MEIKVTLWQQHTDILSETSLESLIQILDMKDERGLRIACPRHNAYHSNSIYFHSRETFGNSVKNLEQQITTLMLHGSGGYLPQGYHIMRRLTDSDQFFIKTDVPDGLKMFQRSPLKRCRGDFETGNHSLQSS